MSGTNLVSNSTFADTTGWFEPRGASTITAVGGELISTSDSTSVFGAYTEVALQIGTQYQLDMTVTPSDLSANVIIRVASQTDLGGTRPVDVNVVGINTVSVVFTATHEEMYLGSICANHNGGDNIAVSSGVILQLYPVSSGVPVSSRRNMSTLANYLRTQGYSGQNNDIIVAWLLSEGIDKGSLNDMMYDYLGTLGYIGTYRDRWYAWREDV